MSYITILSNDIKVYPSGFRTNNPEPNIWIDPEARLNTEFNISHSGGSIKGKDSYIISSVLKNTKYYVECVIHGYYFNFSIAKSTLLNNFDDGDTIYAKIKIDYVSILTDSDDFLTKKLIPFTGTDYDTKNSSDYYFQALILSNEAPSGSNVNIISLPIWTVHMPDCLTVNASLLTETATHIESEENGIPITNRLINGTGTGAIKAISADEASGANSIAIGIGTKATIEGSFAVGKYNIGGKLFEVGCGTSSQRKDLFSIGTDGKTDLVGQFDIKDDSNNSAISISKNNRAAAIYKLLVDANVDDSNFWQDYESEPNTTATLLVDPTATGTDPKIIMRGRTNINDVIIDSERIIVNDKCLSIKGFASSLPSNVDNIGLVNDILDVRATTNFYAGNITNYSYTGIKIKQSDNTNLNLGSTKRLVFIDDGQFTESYGNVGNANSPIYLKDGEFTECSGLIGKHITFTTKMINNTTDNLTTINYTSGEDKTASGTLIKIDKGCIFIGEIKNIKNSNACRIPLPPELLVYSDIRICDGGNVSLCRENGDSLYTVTAYTEKSGSFFYFRIGGTGWSKDGETVHICCSWSKHE